MKSKVVEWVRRYLPAEILGTVGTIVGGLIVHWFTSNTALIALGGVCGENTGYYLTILFSDIMEATRKYKALGVRDAYIIARNIFVEFGFSEVLDTFVTRPFLLYSFIRMINNVPIGLLVGKVGADIAFYVITILMYEWRKKHLRS
jgi:hypothetical protein